MSLPVCVGEVSLVTGAEGDGDDEAVAGAGEDEWVVGVAGEVGDVGDVGGLGAGCLRPGGGKGAGAV